MRGGALALLWASAVSAAVSLDKPLLTVPLNKNGEQYALLDFYSTDPAHIESTAEQFCHDHVFSAGDKAMIIAHVTREMEKVQIAQAQKQQQAIQAVEAAQNPMDRMKLQHEAAAAQHAAQGLPDVNGVSVGQPQKASTKELWLRKSNDCHGGPRGCEPRSADTPRSPALSWQAQDVHEAEQSECSGHTAHLGRPDASALSAVGRGSRSTRIILRCFGGGQSHTQWWGSARSLTLCWHAIK